MLADLLAEFQKLMDFLAELEKTFNKTNSEMQELKD